MSTSFKFFNVLQIILFAILSVCALISAVYYATAFFGLEFLAPVLEIIEGYLAFIPVSYLYFPIFVASLLGLDLEIAFIISLAISVLAFVWFLILFIRLCRPSKHYKKFHVVTLIINILFAIVFAFNAYFIIQEGLSAIGSILALVVCALHVLMTIYHAIMNACGRKYFREENIDPNSFFGGQTYGVAAPMHSAPPAPPRRMPPPPPPRRPQQ